MAGKIWDIICPAKYQYIDLYYIVQSHSTLSTEQQMYFSWANISSIRSTDTPGKEKISSQPFVFYDKIKSLSNLNAVRYYRGAIENINQF